MARRFAGSVFESAAGSSDDPSKSVLAKYFPGVYDLSKAFSKPEEGGTAFRRTGGFAGVPAFGGAKPMKRHAETGVPSFIKPVA
jgi:hypothetical protein